jgi:hypothetical protein
MCHCAPVFKIKAPLQEPDASEQAFGPDGHRECPPPESAHGYVPIANQAVESSTFYSGSTPTINFEIGSNHTGYFLRVLRTQFIYQTFASVRSRDGTMIKMRVVANQREEDTSPRGEESSSADRSDRAAATTAAAYQKVGF